MSTPPKRLGGGGEHRRHLLLGRDVGGDAERPLGAEGGGDLLRALAVEIGDDDARAVARQQLGDRPADPRRRSGDEGDAALQRRRRRAHPQLALLELPVLDAELLVVVDRRVRRHRLGAAHHVDRVDVELAGHARRLRVGAEAPHADTGHEHDHRIGAAHRRRALVGVGVVVRPVVGAVLLVQLLEAGPLLVERRRRRQVEVQRPHLGAQEVVGARRPLGGQPRRRLAGQEVEHDRGVAEGGDHRALRRGHAAHDRGEGGGPLAAFVVGEGGEPVAHRPERAVEVALGEELLGAGDEIEGQRLARLAGVGPADHPVALEHRAAGVRGAALEVAEGEAELEARSLPRQPADVGAVALGDERLAALGGGEGDHRVGVEVVDVVLGDEGVQRGVDRRHGAAVAEPAVLVVGDDVVLVDPGGVHRLEGADPVEIEERQPGDGHRAEVAAGALDGEHPRRRAGDRVGEGHLGGRVAAGEVGHPLVGAEAVGAGQQGDDRRVVPQARHLVCHVR